MSPAELQVIKQEEPTAMGLLQLALDKGASMDTIERLARLHREMRDDQAQLDFDDALNRCQKKLGFVARDMERADGRGKYSSFEALNAAIRPVYVAEGFSVSFSEDEGTSAELVIMVGLLCRAGHKRPYRKVLPVDSKGPKGNDVMTKTDASCAASSRAKRYILKGMFNLAEGEGDNDGEPQGGPRMPEAVVVERIEWIKAADKSSDMVPLFQDAVKEASGDKRAIRDFTNAMLGVCIPWIAGAANAATLQGVFARAYDMADSVGDREAQRQLIAARDARKKVLNANR